MFRIRAGTGEYVRAVRLNLKAGVSSGLLTFYDARGDLRPLRQGENFIPMDVTLNSHAGVNFPIVFYFDYNDDAAGTAFEVFLRLHNRSTLTGGAVKGGFRLPQRLNGLPGITPRMDVGTTLTPGAVVHGFIRSA